MRTFVSLTGIEVLHLGVDKGASVNRRHIITPITGHGMFQENAWRLGEGKVLLVTRETAVKGFPPALVCLTDVNMFITSRRLLNKPKNNSIYTERHSGINSK